MSCRTATDYPMTTLSIQAHGGLFFPQFDIRFATKQDWCHFMRVDVVSKLGEKSKRKRSKQTNKKYCTGEKANCSFCFASRNVKIPPIRHYLYMAQVRSLSSN